MATKKNQSAKSQTDGLTHPNMAATVGFSGFIGIAIPLMDHRYTLLGFAICWGAALALFVLYLPEWRFAFSKLSKKTGYIRVADRRPIARHALISPIFMALYIVSPLLIYFDSSTPSEAELIESWGPAGQHTFQRGNADSITGTLASVIRVKGDLLLKTVSTNYRLVGVCLHKKSSLDILDEQDLSVSGPYDLIPKIVEIAIPWRRAFIEDMVNGLSPTSYVLLAIPKDKINRKFKTIRETQSFGGLFITARAGPP